jgi:hypothetical protein
MTNALPPDEPLVPLRQALGRRLGNPTRSTLVRWATRGLRKPDGVVVKLTAVQVGTRWMTTCRLAEDFAARVTTGTEAVGIVPSARRAECLNEGKLDDSDLRVVSPR